MKKKFSLLLFLIAFVFSLASCSFIDKAFKIEDNKTETNPEENKEPLKEVKDDINDGFTVTFNNNGHGGSLKDLTNIKNLPNPLPILEDNGYDFLGWSYDKEEKNIAKPGDNITKDLILYAIWKQKTYTISYDSNGHGNNPDNSLNQTTLPNPLPTLEDEGYEFIGWTKIKNSKTLVKPGEPINSNIRLYAVWEDETYIITFDENGHGVAPKKILNAKALPDILPTINFEGYEFIGWTLNTKTNILVEPGTEISSNIRLYAVWEKNKYNVSYDSNGHGDAPADILSSTIPNPLPVLTDEGYTFKGWAKSKTSQVLVKAGADIDGDITLYAVWKKNTYRITYHNNGHGEAPLEQTGKISLPNPLPTMTVDDYNFLGWGLSYDSTKEDAVSAGITISANVELYAIWELKTYDITYDSNGHSTNPNKTIGTRKIPDILPSLTDDDYDFLGWSLDKDSTTLVESGKKINDNITLYAVWVLKAATITSIEMKTDSNNYIKDKILDSNNIDVELSKIIYVAKYSDSTDVEITIDKTMLSEDDYNNLKTSGTHNVIFNVLGEAKECVLNTDYYWQVAYYVNGDIYQKAYSFKNGTNANRPANPSDYLDEYNVLWTFDRWDKSDLEVSQNLDINAIFKKVELFNYSVVINSTDKATLSIEYDSRVTGFDILLIDEDTSKVINQFDELSNILELSNLDSDKSYKIKGTYTFIYNEAEYDLNITETVLTTKLVEDLENVEYAIDTRSVSSNAINLDVTKYNEAAPIGYKLSKVYLVDVLNNTLAGEFNYTEEDTIAYFDGLNSNKEYQTVFYYDKINDNQPNLNLLRSAFTFSYEIKFNPEYGFCFMGFRVYTSSDDENMKEVKLVYNDPRRGEKVLYRYYVSKGQDVPYSTFEYSNPFTFALPLIYSDYYAFGDYSELKNIEDDKTVEVYLVKRSYIKDSGKHTIIFVGFNDENRYEDSQYIISVVEVNDGEAVTPPENQVDYDAYLPAENDNYRYEASWGTLNHYWYYYSDPNLDLNNVKSSAVLFSEAKAVSKKQVTVLDVPELSFSDKTYSSNKLIVGDDFVIAYINLRSTKAILGSGPSAFFSGTDYYKGIDVYLTEGPLNSDGTRINSTYFGYYGYSHTFNNLTGSKYVIHYVYQYDINDGTGVHTMHYAIPFALYGEYFDNNVTATSPNYHTIEVVNSDYDDNEGYALIPNNLGEYPLAYHYYYNSKTTANNTYRSLDTNANYKLYTYKVYKNLCVYQKIDGESRIFTTNDCITTNDRLERVSETYQTIKTMDGIKPNFFIFEVPGIAESGVYYPLTGPVYYTHYNRINYSDFGISLFRLKIGNYQTQIDIGKLSVRIFVHHREFANDPERSNDQYELFFEFDSEQGCYVCKDYAYYTGYHYYDFEFYNEVYQYMIYTNANVDISLHFEYYYNKSYYEYYYLSDNKIAENPKTPPTSNCIIYYDYQPEEEE